MEVYRKILKELDLPVRRDPLPSLPFSVIGQIESRYGIAYGPIVRPELTSQGLWAVPDEYRSNPSHLRILVMLELALLEREMSNENEYHKFIRDALRRVAGGAFDYRADLRFRLQIIESTQGFARPEEGVVYAAAEDARRAGRAREAINWYTKLIEGSPGSPFAWEALAVMSVMAETPPKELQRLRNILLDTWPLVWGCPRPLLKLSKEQFAERLPGLLKQAAEERLADEK